jgi:hypothetical protein
VPPRDRRCQSAMMKSAAILIGLMLFAVTALVNG